MNSDAVLLLSHLLLDWLLPYYHGAIKCIPTGDGWSSIEDAEAQPLPAVQCNLIDTQEASAAVTFSVLHSIKLIFQRD